MKKILVTGGSGLVGNAINTIKYEYNYEFIFTNSNDYDLTNLYQTKLLFENTKPNFVIHLAAYVGGLFKNLKYKVNMYEKNILINNNVLKCCHDYNVEKVISCLSTCIFPDNIKYPINESMLHNGPPHFSNQEYAYAKRMLDIHSNAYQTQYNNNFICIIPTNIYGPYDNFSLEDGHVIPSLIHRCYISKKNNENFIIKGTGKPLRQFIFSEDLAKLIMIILEKYEQKTPIIVSVNEEQEISIKNIAYIIAKKFDYQEKVVFDDKFADGQFKKTADNSKLINLINEYNFVSIDNGIDKTIKWFIDNYDNCRK